MSQKKPSRLSTKPGKDTQAINADSWVENRQDNNEISGEPATKRITFEVSEPQHRAIKILAAQKGLTIKELMQSLLVSELNKQ